jgi:RNA polymerase sigma-70 factor (ECF subfamily)
MVKDARVIGLEADVVATTTSADMVLAQRCADGDQQACRDLVDEHRGMVFGLGFQLLGNYDEALDLSQEVFLRVFRTIGRFRGGATLRTWIYRIVVNGARNRQRWFQRHRRAFLVQLDAYVEDHGDPVADANGASPERALNRVEAGRRLWAGLARLSLEQRTALVLRELHGMSYVEVGYTLGVTTSAVKSRLSRARETLRRELTP